MSFQGHGPQLPLPITISERATLSPTQFLTTLCGRHGGGRVGWQEGDRKREGVLQNLR